MLSNRPSSHQPPASSHKSMPLNEKIALAIFPLIGLLIAFIIAHLGTYRASDTGSSQQQGNQNSSQQQGATVNPGQESLSGIVIGTLDELSNNWTLTAYTTSGSTTPPRVFAFKDYHQSTLWGNFGTNGDRIIARQLFNADYTKMAVYQTRADGSNDIGYIDESGTFTNLTPQSSSYSSLPNQTDPIFNPVTGREWFNTPTKLGSVDPKAGADSSRVEPFNTFGDGFYFAPKGDMPLDTAPPPGDLLQAYQKFIYSPDGKTKVEYFGGNYNYDTLKYSGGGFKINGGKLIPFPANVDFCFPKEFITNDDFLCLTYDSTQIYKVTVSSGATVPLLPSSDRKVSKAIGDPAGKQVAFIATTGTVISLYVVPAKGGEPAKLADINSNSVLLSWEP